MGKEYSKVLMKKKRLTKYIYLVHFRKQNDMARTFLRFQEHYESPKFMDKVFTHKEFKQWYTKLKGKFTYYQEWDGFNIPSRVLKRFYQGHFDPLSKNEKMILKLFRNEKHDFYIIAVHGKAHVEILKHELAHGLFYTHPAYKKEAINIMKKYSLNHIRKELLSLGGYNKKVLNDEMQAYAISLSHELKSEMPKEMKEELTVLFHTFIKK